MNPESEYIIRRATNDDIPDIKHIVFDVLLEYGLRHSEEGKDRDLNDIEESYFGKGGYFGVLFNADLNQIVGTFGLYRLSPATCELRKMYLKKEERGKGLGKFMLDSAINTARELHFSKITLETISPLKEAIALYMSYGFKEIPPAEINDRVDQAFELELN